MRTAAWALAVALAVLPAGAARSAPASVSLEANCLPAALAATTNEQNGVALSQQWADDRGFLWEFWSGSGGWLLTILSVDEKGVAFRCLMGAGTPAGDPA